MWLFGLHAHLGKFLQNQQMKVGCASRPYDFEWKQIPLFKLYVMQVASRDGNDHPGR